MDTFLTWLQTASGNDFDGQPDEPGRLRRKLTVTVAIVAFSLLMLEVLLTRLFPFLLGNISSFLAIPVAMFGLSLGALAQHWMPSAPKARAIPGLLLLLFVTTLLSLLACFELFNEVFNLTHHKLQNPRDDALKTLVLSTVFVPPFAVGGVLLSTAFTAGAREVGRLYAFDLVGSALACVAAPVLLHWLDLPLVLVALLTALSVAIFVVFSSARRTLVPALGALLLLLGVLGAFQIAFTEQPDPDVLGVRYAKGRSVEERRHRWNEVSRVALMKFFHEGKTKGTSHRIIHDDGISNVIVRKYDPDKVTGRKRPGHAHGVPFVLEKTPKSALVMFAGAGQDMVMLNEFGKGEVDITGVELNGRVPWLVTSHGWDLWNLQAFYDLPQIDLRADEGRAFLNRDKRRYDTIFVASNGAQHASRTGHSRKFLDTFEAMEAYLDHLEPGGVIVFNQQPLRHRLEIWKRLLEDRNLATLDEAGIVVSHYKRPSFRVDTLLLKPSGFTDAERETLVGAWNRPDKRRWVHYAKDGPRQKRYREAIESPPDRAAFVPIDDRPYEREIVLEGFTLTPDRQRFRNINYSLNWVKLFTVLLFTGLTLLTLIAFYVKPRGGRRLPVWLAAYFLATGICYMLAQIGLMAKLELFMGKPLYSVAVVLASFLLANGAGSALVDRLDKAGKRPSVLVPAFGAALAVPLTLVLVEALLGSVLGMSPLVKAPLALLAMSPLALLLGMFYPLGVSLAVDRDLRELVPMTFGLATLSSVVGSTWAMVAVINLGFRKLILLAAVGYLLIAITTAVARRLAR